MLRALFVLLAVFVSVLLLTNPTGDFPLNDDWSYGTAVRNLVEHGQFRLSNWTSMPFLPQLFWGALFTLPFGFSFTALRFSTLIASFLGLTLLLLLTRIPRTSPPSLLLTPRSFIVSLFPALLLLANPLYLGLSHTFMTDVPFITLLLLSLYLLASAVEKPSRVRLALGMCAAVTAALHRQTGLLIPIAFGLSWLTLHRPSVRRLTLALGFLAVTAAALLGYLGWLRVAGHLPTAFSTQPTEVLKCLRAGLPAVAARASQNLLVFFTYLSIFTLPFGLLFIRSATIRRLLLFLPLSFVLLALTQLLRVRFPGNILSDRGLGPFTLAGTFSAFSGSVLSLVVLAALALLGGALLIELIRAGIAQARSSLAARLCVILTGLYLLAFSLVTPLDRYALVCLPLLTIAASGELHQSPPSRPVLFSGLAVLAVYLTFSVAAVHDYLEWNRVRWQALNRLTRDLSLPPERIDGGFEFNGLYTYDEDHSPAPGRSRWWVKADDYVVAFDPLPGFVVSEEHPVRTWLPAGVKRIFLLTRPVVQP